MLPKQKDIIRSVLKMFLIAVIISLGSYTESMCQKTTILDTSNKNYAKVIAGKQYEKSGMHRFFWGNHYRKEWATPVTMKVVMLDTLEGGLTPVEKGGGRQTKTLRLVDKNGKQYVLRSIDKTFGKALPEVFRGTFVEGIVNDQVSIAHPYSSVTVPQLAEAAGVFHTNPRLFYVPSQAALGEFNTEFANQLYLFEERPAGNQEDAANFGFTADVDGTDKMLKKIYEENDHRVDQQAFIRARLFDMFLSDWGRHEDQWRWATFKEGDVKIYRPIPRDRDQSYTKFDGMLVSIGTSLQQLSYLESFDRKIQDVGGYNFYARHLDRQLANEPTQDSWISIAKELQLALTDQVIENSVKQLPPEVYPISGKTLITNLKGRRDRLVDFAVAYYKILAKEVEVVGTEQKELVEITGLSGQVEVKLYDLDKDEVQKSKPFYSRLFNKGETQEIRVYGLNGKDKFSISGNIEGMKVRVIGGPKKDEYMVNTSKGKLQLYDDVDNDFKISSPVHRHLSSDSAIHAFNYRGYKPDYEKVIKTVGYTNEDRIYLGIHYLLRLQKWRKTPYGSLQDFAIHYSLTQKAFSLQYKGDFRQVIGKWNLNLFANYDFIRDLYFTGIGNDGVLTSPDKYYKYRNREANASIGLNREIGKGHLVGISGFYQMVDIIKDAGKYIGDIHGAAKPSALKGNSYAGATLSYIYEKLNDHTLPSKGIHFSTDLKYTHDFQQPGSSFGSVSGVLGFYLPVLPNVTLAVKGAAATLSEVPSEFYLFNKLGGGNVMRGFLRYRFYGKSMAYNQNELQWNIPVKTYIFKGSIGLLGLFDNGRVWNPSENSTTWHTAYGGGIALSPFNKVSLTATYAVSNEAQRINLRLGRLF